MNGNTVPSAPGAGARTRDGGRSPHGLAAIGLTALLCAMLLAAPAWPQMPDNRGVKLNPEDPLSAAYEDTLDRRDEQRKELARERGESFVPMFHGAGQAPEEALSMVPMPDRNPEDGWTERAGTVREPPAARPSPVYETAALPELRTAGADGGLAAMIAALLESWTRPPEIVDLRYAAPRERGGEDAAGAAAAARGPQSPAPRDAGLPHVAAGTGLYARTLYAVDSDYPGPVVLELLQPPLTGAVAHGGFERVRQRLVLRLTSLTWRGRTFPLDAWAVDPGCACYGIEGEVDRHFLSRVLLPAAARFAEGFMTAIAAPARTLTMQDGAVFHERGAGGEREALHAGAGAAARTLGDILTADAPSETTVRIPRDTPLVVMVARHFAASPGPPTPDMLRRERADAGE